MTVKAAAVLWVLLSPIVCYTCFARSLFEEMWAKQHVVWGNKSGLAADKFSSAELVTAWPRDTSRRRILDVLRSLLAKMWVMNLGGVWIRILDLDIYMPHVPQSSPFVALGPEMTIQRRTQICHSKYMPKHLFISCFKWWEKCAERVTEDLHLPQILCIFPPAVSEAWDQLNNLSIPSNI